MKFQQPVAINKSSAPRTPALLRRGRRRQGALSSCPRCEMTGCSQSPKKEGQNCRCEFPETLEMPGWPPARRVALKARNPSGNGIQHAECCTEIMLVSTRHPGPQHLLQQRGVPSARTHWVVRTDDHLEVAYDKQSQLLTTNVIPGTSGFTANNSSILRYVFKFFLLFSSVIFQTKV